MKKLMILAAAAAFACTVNAASATWGFSSTDIKDRDGDYAGDSTVMTAFLYLGTATTTATNIDLTGLTLLATAGQDTSTYQFGVFDAPVELAGLTSDDAGQAYTLVLAEGDGLTTLTEGDTYWMVVAPGTGAQATDPMSGATWATFLDGTDYGVGDWQSLTVGTSAVPEPTSGLLMLLGMAGLALRRRRA